MTQLIAAIVAFLWFVVEFLFDVANIAVAALISVWEALWDNLIKYHNRVQLWADNGRDLFIAAEEEELEEDADV